MRHFSDPPIIAQNKGTQLCIGAYMCRSLVLAQWCFSGIDLLGNANLVIQSFRKVLKLS